MRYSDKVNRLELENIALTQMIKWLLEEKELLKEQIEKLVDKLEVYKCHGYVKFLDTEREKIY